jgi:Uma2 family endonuclease
MSEASQLPTSMTVAEFLVWNDPGYRELVDGTPRARDVATPRQAEIHAEAAQLIGNRVAELPGQPRHVACAPGIQPKVRADWNVRVPDLAVTFAAPDADDALLRDPFVLIEILSPSNRSDTWADVWSYTTIPSVREILVLYSEEIRADLLRREEDGTWPDNPLALTSGDDVTLESIGFSAPLAAFYRTATA